MPDIDIDFADRDIVLDKIQHRIAKLETGKKHNTGVYVTECPHNPVDNLSTIDYKTADDRGYVKLDCLNVSIYNDIVDEKHLQRLMNKEPEWSLLQHDDFVDLIFHISGHGDILRTTKPQSVEQLAAVLAMIRPAKRHLVNETWTTILENVWVAPTDGSYYFKKAHAISYAMACVVHMNMVCEDFISSA
jgi:hypothetical protein